jgi:hypothetical protein
MSPQNKLKILNKAPSSMYILVQAACPRSGSFIDNKSGTVPPGNATVKNGQIIGLLGYVPQLCGL